MTRIHSYPVLKEGRLIRRYKRFLADVRLAEGGSVTAFCPNSGSMLGLREPGMPVLLSRSEDQGRKTRWTLEAVRPGRSWVGVNTHLTNRLARELIERGILGGALKGCRVVRPEVRAGRSRLDFLLRDGRGEEMYLEVKSVTLRVGAEARFPDAVTSRGARHLRELACISRKGRAAMLYIVQRPDCACLRTADEIDPAYGEAFRKALGAGVMAEAHKLTVRRDGVYYNGRMEFCK